MTLVHVSLTLEDTNHNLNIYPRLIRLKVNGVFSLKNTRRSSQNDKFNPNTHSCCSPRTFSMALVEGRVLETVLTDILSNQLPRFAGSGCRLLSGVVLISRESRKRRLDVWRNVNILLSVVVSVSLLSSKVEGKRFIHCCLFFSDVCPSKEMMSKGHAGRVGRHPPGKLACLSV